MTDLSKFISTTMPSDSSLVVRGPAFIREQHTLIDRGMRQSLDLPDGTISQGAAPIRVAAESTASNAGGHEKHGKFQFTSDTSRLFFYRTQNTSATYGSNWTHLIGTHRFIEHDDYAASIDSLRACQSGASRIIDDSHTGAAGALGSYSFNFSHNGIGAAAFEFTSVPLVLLSMQADTAATNYAPRVSAVTKGGFTGVFHPSSKGVLANSIETVHWTAYGYRDTVL